MNKYEKNLIWHLDVGVPYYPQFYAFKLSEQFIRENINLFEWKYISSHQHLSENFIREFFDKVDWRFISIQQKLSKKFIKEFSNKIYLQYIPLYILNVNNEYSWRTFL